MHPNQFRGQAQDQHDEQNGGDDRDFDHQVVVGPADDPSHHTPPDREADSQKKESTENAQAHISEAYGAMGGDARDHGDDDPGDGVIENGGGKDELRRSF